MPAFKDLTGQKFSRLTAIRRVGSNKQGRTVWLCGCECGKEIEVRSADLASGNTKSCGCLQRELSAARMKGHFGKDSNSFKHGHCSHVTGRSPEHVVWNCMIKRCTNPNDAEHWLRYGGAGVTVCERWLGEHGFENFLTDMGLRPSSKHSLSRRLDIGNYEKSNCEWALIGVQRAEAMGKRVMQRLHAHHQLESIFEIEAVPAMAA